MLASFKHIVDDSFVNGEYFSKRQEGSAAPGSPNCLLKLDEDGLFLLWSFSNQPDINVLETTHIREAITGISLKDVKALSGLSEGDNVTSNRVLTIYHGFEIGSLSMLQFVSPTTEQAEKWVVALNKVIHCLDSHFLSPLHIIKKQWKRLCYSISSRGGIPVRRIVKHFGHDKNEKVVLQKLKSCGFTCAKNDEIDPKEFTFDVYKNVHSKICYREDLENLFAEITGKKEHIELAQLIQWLNDNQRDPRLNEILAPPFDDKRAASIIAKYESCSKNVKNNRISKQGFFDYLSSEDNCLVYRDHLSLCHDMDQPLNHYFINSSHNTYLTGFQWRGKSSVDIYRHALLAGYRCIELDCWDGKGEYHGEPIITHGKAMCTDVVFKNVLVAIRDAAFVTSDFPVILSFETHCSKPLQLKMAKYCEEVFGDLLLSQPMDSHPLESGVPLPSPNSLKRKILIKNKRLDPDVEKVQLENLSRNKDYVLDDEPEEAHPELDGSKDGDAGIDSLPYPTNNDVAVSTEMLSKPAALPQDQSMNGLKSKPSLKKTSSNGFPEDDEMELAHYEYTKTSATNIHPYLSSLVSYCQSVKFPGFKKLEDNKQKRCYHMSSFSETAGLNYLKSSAIDFVNYNRSQLSRIYPKGARFDSSNYMPQIFWNAGCQMVSLNAQTYDLGVQLNKEKFNYNGRSGYLLKPDVLLKGSKSFDPFAEFLLDGVIAAQCGIKIISSQFLADRPINSYVEVDMYGLPTDTIRKENRTNITTGNALNPVYNKESNEFLFRKVICPDLALLRFMLYDENRQLLGQRVVPLGSLQTGYRYIPLRNSAGVPLDSAMIFAKITLKSYVPDSLLEIASALENPKAHLSLMKHHAQQLRCLEGDDAEEEEEESSEELDVVPPMSNGIVRKTGKEELSIKISRNKTSQKQKAKEQLTQKSSNSSNAQGSLYTKTDDRKAIEEVVESSQVTMDTLLSHPMYLKAMENHRKECSKRSKKERKNNSRKIHLRSNSEAAPCCTGFRGLFFTRRRRTKNNNLEVASGSFDEDINRPLSPCRRRKVLLNVLEAVHEETREKLKKTQEKEMSDLTQEQTKRWIENSKMIGKDKSIPAAERDRRIRDLKNQDIKNFTEVRQTMKNRQMKQLERLDSFLKDESEKIKKLIEAELN